MKVIGLMSGTSVDGIDAALCEIAGSGESLTAQVLDFRCFPWENELRERILRACANECDVREVARLNVEIGEAFARAALGLIEEHGPVELIGSHGQTICHLPDNRATLQIGEPSIIAARTGTTVVADFRVADMAQGGQGAPLIAYADWVLLRDKTKNRVIQNIGGIANCTVLPAGCDLEQVRAWDTGPGNMVMDECARQLFGVSFDRNGGLAAQGNPASWFYRDLGRLHPFFAQKPPKTAGREEFGAAFAAGFHTVKRDPHDILAEVTWITAYSIAESLRQFAGFDGDFEMIVGGGGAQNSTLMRMLRDELPRATIRRHEDVGIDSDAKEALAFAILAHGTLHGVATGVPGATGARKAAILGKIVRA
ncbi:MAG: anhydro-N-acetylmuramic acid kinase [Armatimonadetes bacterium]|nr:anhydro-N-acetylmuramic acid kinase [Armatimonadota bacterium]